VGSGSGKARLTPKKKKKIRNFNLEELDVLTGAILEFYQPFARVHEEMSGFLDKIFNFFSFFWISGNE
jgi:hypothetical protein